MHFSSSSGSYQRALLASASTATPSNRNAPPSYFSSFAKWITEQIWIVPISFLLMTLLFLRYSPPLESPLPINMKQLKDMVHAEMAKTFGNPPTILPVTINRLHPPDIWAKVRFLPDSAVLRIVVTGGAGFIGSHLVDRLMLEGHQVTVLDNFSSQGSGREMVSHWMDHPNFHLIAHDVTEPILLVVDQIYHLAATPHRARSGARTDMSMTAMLTSTQGTLNMLGLAKRCGARMLLASSSAVYGDPVLSVPGPGPGPISPALSSAVASGGFRSTGLVGKSKAGASSGGGGARSKRTNSRTNSGTTTASSGSSSVGGGRQLLSRGSSSSSPNTGASTSGSNLIAYKLVTVDESSFSLLRSSSSSSSSLSSSSASATPASELAAYAEGKRAAETLVYAYSKSQQQHQQREQGQGTVGLVDVRVARIFDTYGPRMPLPFSSPHQISRPPSSSSLRDALSLSSSSLLMGQFIAQALQGSDINIAATPSTPSPGAKPRPRFQPLRPLLYVEDLVEGLVRLMNSKHSQPVNLGGSLLSSTELGGSGEKGTTTSSSSLSEWDLATMVKQLALSNSTIKVTTTTTASTGSDHVVMLLQQPDIRLARRVLHGWQPQVSLQEGLSRTIAFFKP